MKLSESMRLGSMLKPQGFGGYVRDGRTCAVGAALDACGLLSTHFEDMLPIVNQFPILRARVDVCPACGALLGWQNLASVVFHLNDNHCWTREAIADYVASIEQQQETAPAMETANVLVAVTR